MIKFIVCAVFQGFFCCAVWAGNIDCVKFLHAGNEKVCMKTLKETSPSLATRIDGVVYYASSISENRGGIRFEYDGVKYSLYNYDDTEYELIHWLSGADALADGVWRDKVAIGGALDFVNHGCVWNDEHDGYYSVDGLEQYFETSDVPILDFGSDWYVEIVAQVGEPLGEKCYFLDFGSVSHTSVGIGFGISNYSANGSMPGMIDNNGKFLGAWVSVVAGKDVYVWGERAQFITGASRYSTTKSRAFITWNGNRYYGGRYDTERWVNWERRFFLFRGVSESWNSGGVPIVGKCGPTTIYDIKVWRKK